MSAKKEYKEIVEELRRQGWTVTLTTQGHNKAVPPDPDKMIIHFSTSDDQHALLNTLRDLRRQGFVWPVPSRNELAGRLPDRGSEPLCPDCHQLLSEHTQCLAAPATSPRIETPEARMDRLFAELKERKTYHELTVEHLRECEARVMEAERALQDARAEHDAAVSALTTKKREFDTAFGAVA